MLPFPLAPSVTTPGPSSPLGRNTVRQVTSIQPKLANWNHFRAFWVHLVRAPAPRCGAPNMDHFPVQRDRWRKIFIGCFPNLQKNRNLSYWIAKNLCNVCTPQTPIFVKNWGSTKAKTPARTTSRSLTVVTRLPKYGNYSVLRTFALLHYTAGKPFWGRRSKERNIVYSTLSRNAYGLNA